jgi:hypothetical protein
MQDVSFSTPASFDVQRAECIPYHHHQYERAAFSSLDVQVESLSTAFSVHVQGVLYPQSTF